MAQSQGQYYFVDAKAITRAGKAKAKAKTKAKSYMRYFEDPRGQHLASRTPSPVPIPLFLQPHYKTSSTHMHTQPNIVTEDQRRTQKKMAELQSLLA